MKDEYFDQLAPERRVPKRRHKPLAQVLKEHAAELQSLGEKDRQLAQAKPGGITSRGNEK